MGLESLTESPSDAVWPLPAEWTLLAPMKVVEETRKHGCECLGQPSGSNLRECHILKVWTHSSNLEVHPCPHVGFAALSNRLTPSFSEPSAPGTSELLGLHRYSQALLESPHPIPPSRCSLAILPLILAALPISICTQELAADTSSSKQQKTPSHPHL